MNFNKIQNQMINHVDYIIEELLLRFFFTNFETICELLNIKRDIWIIKKLISRRDIQLSSDRESYLGV